ncbi:hypothetical protein [Streptomyces sp. NPDC005969]|uniref:hypothetical protein n=1 Tax=Streptomyces sp. NPDC005969 TaxID=3156722 RepID=UPI0034091BCC
MTRITAEQAPPGFATNPDVAAFSMYLTARVSMRSILANGKQRRPYDEVADAPFQRLPGRRSDG